MDDLLYFQDDAGNEIALMMINNFAFGGKEYALLATPDDAEDGGIYVMRMEEANGELSFAMPDDDEMEALTPTLTEILEHMSGGCPHDCCSCHGCHDEEDTECRDDHCSCCEH
ncbi:MAG: DUF1292 domain-containing protein [Clostridia bacterium]|nr:DUF1292 domain-containing protein [Clostridia bacterium]